MSKFNIFSILLMLTVALAGCRNEDYINSNSYDDDDDTYDESQVDLSNYPDWTEATHSNAADPNYDVVFEQDAVLNIYITISSSSWSAMWSDLSSNFRYIDSSSSSYTPMWAPCTVTFNNTDWYQVGVRFKGNSSLSQTYASGNKKLSLKLDFDQYEDNYPALKNQRFYGFKQLNLNNNYEDESLMREKVGSDLFRKFGIASAQTSFCRVFINTGSNNVYYGVYTIVEEVDDTVIKEQFSDSSGNLYKPDGDAASFKSGTYDTSELYLKTNTSSPNYSDVLSLYNALHSSNRTTDTVAWREQLESVFNVEIFLKWLAANAAIQNWDTYGVMTHNYYLYNNPTDGLLTWIPWDNNEAFQNTQNNCIGVNQMGYVSTSWPLINYLFDIPEYEEMYKGYLREFVDTVFVVSEMQALYEEYYNLLKTYAYAESSGYTFINSDSEFDSAVSTLKTHVQTRATVVNNYLD
ncbi:MAG: CotH kinase family protein [Rikenellaceae bacterium]